MPKTLSHLSISTVGEDYVLHIATDDGETIDVNATYEQLDLIGEAIDEQLDADEEEKMEAAGEE